MFFPDELAAELGFCQLSQTKIYEDNEGAMVLVKNMHLRNRSIPSDLALHKYCINLVKLSQLLFLPSISMQTSTPRRQVSRSSIATCQYGWAKYCLPNPEKTGGCFGSTWVGSTWERRGLKT